MYHSVGRNKDNMLVSWCFEHSQPQRITIKAERNKDNNNTTTTTTTNHHHHHHHHYHNDNDNNNNNVLISREPLVCTRARCAVQKNK